MHEGFDIRLPVLKILHQTLVNEELLGLPTPHILTISSSIVTVSEISCM